MADQCSLSLNDLLVMAIGKRKNLLTRKVPNIRWQVLQNAFMRNLLKRIREKKAQRQLKKVKRTAALTPTQKDDKAAFVRIHQPSAKKPRLTEDDPFGHDEPSRTETISNQETSSDECPELTSRSDAS